VRVRRKRVVSRRNLFSLLQIRLGFEIAVLLSTIVCSPDLRSRFVRLLHSIKECRCEKLGGSTSIW